MIKKIIPALLLVLAFGYFNYWQGYYRGADTVLCIVASVQNNTKIEQNTCPNINNVYFHWKGP